MRKDRDARCTCVRGTTYKKVSDCITTALCESPKPPTVLMSKIEQIMQPSQREIFFCSFAILVEGLEDIAFVATLAIMVSGINSGAWVAISW